VYLVILRNEIDQGFGRFQGERERERIGRGRERERKREICRFVNDLYT